MVMANRSDQQGGQISVGKQIVLHLAPGVLATALFVLLNSLLSVERVPAILILQICLYLVRWLKNSTFGGCSCQG